MADCPLISVLQTAVFVDYEYYIDCKCMYYIMYSLSTKPFIKTKSDKDLCIRQEQYISNIYLFPQRIRYLSIVAFLI